MLLKRKNKNRGRNKHFSQISANENDLSGDKVYYSLYHVENILSVKSLRIDSTLILNLQEHQNYTIYNSFSLQTEKKKDKKLRNPFVLILKKM